MGVSLISSVACICQPHHVEMGAKPPRCCGNEKADKVARVLPESGNPFIGPKPVSGMRRAVFRKATAQFVELWRDYEMKIV